MKWHHYCSLYKRWTTEEQSKWEKLRAEGKRRFVLFRGVFFWGGWCFALMTFFMLADSETYTASREVIVISNLIIWTCGGAIFGELVWWGTNKSYAEKFGSEDAGS